MRRLTARREAGGGFAWPSSPRSPASWRATICCLSSSVRKCKSSQRLTLFTRWLALLNRIGLGLPGGLGLTLQCLGIRSCSCILQFLGPLRLSSSKPVRKELSDYLFIGPGWSLSLMFFLQAFNIGPLSKPVICTVLVVNFRSHSFDRNPQFQAMTGQRKL